MIAKARHHRRGSVVIMVVGLLTLLAMIGSTLVIVSFLDRREARSIAATVPMKNVARSVLGRILTRLADGLYISDNGTPNDPSDDVLYGLADTAAKRIDYPHEDVDKHLASFDLHYDTALGFVWKHVSNIPGDLLNPTDVPMPVDDPRLADTDRVGYLVEGINCWGDSLLWDSGMQDSADRHLMVATRIVDASGLLAVNLAHRPAAAPTDGSVMPITDLSLVPLLRLLGETDDVAANQRLDSLATARLGPDHSGDTIVNYWTNYALRPNNVGDNRQYYPFTVEDMLAAAWFTTRPRTGRLYSVLGKDPFAAARPYLTVASVGRISVMSPDRSRTEQKYKVDLNKADFDALYNAFYNLLAHLEGPDRSAKAAQMAVNVIDFRDIDSDITREKAREPEEGPIVYGVERQLFLTEAAYKRESDGAAIPVITSYYAIELFNPFKTDIDITGWQVQVGTEAPKTIPDTDGMPGNTIRAGRRLVIVNDAGEIKVDAGAREEEIDTLDLTKDVLILRPIAAGDPNYVVVDRISKADFRAEKWFDREPDPEKPQIECLRRDDTLANAFYALPIYNRDMIEEDITAAGNLGKDNGAVTLSIPDVRPCPVYVRNGNFVNVADVCRILAIGPGEDVCLSDGLPKTKATSLYNGRLDMDGTINPIPAPAPAVPPDPPAPPGWGDGIPALPLGCMPWEFLMVHSPMEDTVDNEGDGQPDSADTNGGEDLVYGRVNINTAPHEVLQCLPSLASMPQADRDKIVREIISYRDLDDNDGLGLAFIPGSGGGSPYKTATDGRATALGIANLRNEPGFASPGEIVLPLLARASKDDITAENKLPKDTYSSNQAPDNYAVSDGATLTDDGLSTADATTVSGDLVKHHVYASWLSNHVTVRSDVYLVYIAVYASTAEGSGIPTTAIGGTTLRDTTKSWKDDKWLRNRAQEERLHVVFFKDGVVNQIRRITGNDATTLSVATPWSGVAVDPGKDRYQILSVKRRYVALIDRSNVRSVGDRPEVLMFAEVR